MQLLPYVEDPIQEMFNCMFYLSIYLLHLFIQYVVESVMLNLKVWFEYKLSSDSEEEDYPFDSINLRNRFRKKKMRHSLNPILHR